VTYLEKYTAQNNLILEKKISDIVSLMTREIITRFHPKSIILSGSFGKGEITVNECNGCLQFLSDCEVIIIPNLFLFNQHKIKQFSDEFYNTTGLKVGISGILLSIYVQHPFLCKNLKPTMANYDLKWGSKVIYGKNYLDTIPNFNQNEIPLWEGLRLLFNRMAEALQYFSREKPSDEMVFWTDKIIIACQDALLLSLGKYHYSFGKRNKMFQHLFPRHFIELNKNLPTFLEISKQATERKLYGTRNDDDPIGYWFDAAEICDAVFRFVIEKDMGITFNTYLEYHDKYMMYQNAKLHSGFLSGPIRQNLRSIVKMWIFGYELPIVKLMQRIMTPWRHAVYSMIPLVYFSLSKGEEIDYDMLEKIKNNMILFNQSNDHVQKSTEAEWVHFKKQMLDLWHIICY